VIIAVLKQEVLNIYVLTVISHYKVLKLKNDPAKVCGLLGCDNPYYRGSYNVPEVGDQNM